MLKITGILIAMLGLGVMHSEVAHATQLDAYAINGASCSAADPAIQNNRYMIQSGAVKHTATNIDLISLYCFIPEVDAGVGHGPTKLYVTYRDSTGTATGGFVDVSVIQMSLTDGSLTTVGTFLSDAFADPGHPTQNFVNLIRGFDFFNNAYYLRIDMQRSSTSDVVTFYAAQLRS